jgi:microcystin degradation protein MlrC
MTHFIELTWKGQKFLGNVSQIKCIDDRKSPEGNTYISGLNNNGGFYVEESYEEIKTAIETQLRLHSPIIQIKSNK